MNTVYVRPRLDQGFDVIQSRTPQMLGTRQDLVEATTLAEWAAARSTPCRLVILEADGVRVRESRDVNPLPG